MTYLNRLEHCRPVQGPMTLAQLTEAMRRAYNRAHDDASRWGRKYTGGGYYSAWLWCQEVSAGRPHGDLNWLARQRLQECMEVTALDDRPVSHDLTDGTSWYARANEAN